MEAFDLMGKNHPLLSELVDLADSIDMAKRLRWRSDPTIEARARAPTDQGLFVERV
jgi:hypothetical protein